MAYIGNNPSFIRQGRRAVYTFTATLGQRDFTGVDDNGLTLDLLDSNENSVYLNGVRLIEESDYNTAGDTLTLVSAAAIGDQLVIVTQDEIQNVGSYTKAEADSRYINYDGDIVNGDIQIVGELSATTLVGDGSALTGIDTDLVADTTPQLGGDLDTNGNDINFGDNDKAIFGAGSDLQIFHDGDNSYINDAGTGDLIIYGANLRLGASGTGEQFIRCYSNDRVDLYYDNEIKLATTSTGIDVTGTITTNALSIGTNNAPTDSDISLSGNAVIGGENSVNITTGSNGFTVRTGASDASAGYSDAARALKVEDGGDVSFYDDTGSNVRFFWDASTERLGIGNDNPEDAIHISDGANSAIRLGMVGQDFGYRLRANVSSSVNGGFLIEDAVSGEDCYQVRSGNSGFHAFSINGTESMRIDSGGRVLTPYQPAFFAYNDQAADGHLVFDSVNATAIWGSTRFNKGNCYSTSTGRFTAPVDGTYSFTVHAGLWETAGDSQITPRHDLRINGALVSGCETYCRGYQDSTTTTATLYLYAGDYVTFTSRVIGRLHQRYSNFSGYLVG